MTSQPYFLPTLAVLGAAGWVAWRALRFGAVRRQMPALLAEGAIVVDVRTRGEYARGARPGSTNIPIDQLEKRAARLDREKPIVVCCATGARSASAAAILKAQGFTRVINAGPWTNTLP